MSFSANISYHIVQPLSKSLTVLKLLERERKIIQTLQKWYRNFSSSDSQNIILQIYNALNMQGVSEPMTNYELPRQNATTGYGSMMLPGAYGAYPTQRGIPYSANQEPRKSKGKIYSQSAE